MAREHCIACQDIFPSIREEHPDWSVEEVIACCVQSLNMVRKDTDCRKFICEPMVQLRRFGNELEDRKEKRKPPPLVPFEPSRPDFQLKADEIVENRIKDEVFGHPDKWTAYSHQKNCGCPDSKRVYDEWKKLYGK